MRRGILKVIFTLLALTSMGLGKANSQTWPGCSTCGNHIQDGACDTNTEVYTCVKETDPSLTDCSRIDSYMVGQGYECPI